MHPNPYKPPSAGTMTSDRSSAAKATPPVALLLRWAIAIFLIGYSLVALVNLSRIWNDWIDKSIISKSYSPYPLLLLDLCVLSSGVLLALRYRVVLIPILAHCGLFLWLLFFREGIQTAPAFAYLVWSAQLGTLGFCSWLALNGRLR